MKITERRGRFVAYDKQKVLEEIVRGNSSARDIADRHGITRDMVYSLKHAAKKKNIIRETVPKLNDLFPVEPTHVSHSTVREIHQLAVSYKNGDLDDMGFYQEACKTLNA